MSGIPRWPNLLYHDAVTYTFRYHEDDSIEALLVNRKKFLRLYSAIFAAVMALLGVQTLMARAWLFAVVALTFAVAIPFLVFWRQRHALRNVFRASPLVNVEVAAEIDDEGVRLTYPAGRHDLNWSSFSSFAETPKAFVLYSGRVPLRILPKASLAPEQLAEMRALITAHVRPQ